MATRARGALALARRLHCVTASPALLCTVRAPPRGGLAWLGPASAAAFHAAAPAREGNPFGALSAQAERRKKLLNSLAYRAKQRGFLELDLLGGWAERHLPSLSDEELAAFAVVLDMENPDLYKWLTGQAATPREMATNPAYVKLHAHCAAQLAEHARQATRGAAGKEWVRGWSDSGFPSSGNQQ